MDHNMKLTLKAARVNAGMTQKDAAKALETTDKTVCAWENGKNAIPGIALVKLCDLYGVSVESIILPGM